MLSDIIKGKKYTYRLLLCKMNREPLCFIPYTDLTFDEKFNDYDELSFTVPKYIDTWKNGKKKKITNPAWEKIKSNSLILMQIYNGEEIIKEEYMSVSDPNLSSEEANKQINCVAAHQFTFNHIKLSGYDDTRKLYDFDNETGEPIPYKLGNTTSLTTDEEEVYIDTSFTTGGILNYIIEYKLNNPDYYSDSNHWHVSYYDPALDETGNSAKFTDIYLKDFSERVTGYWKYSYNNNSFSDYTAKEGQSVGDYTLSYWRNAIKDLLDNRSITEIYLARIELETKLNRICELIDIISDNLGGGSSDTLTKFLKDPYIGTLMLVQTEKLITYYQSFIDSIINTKVSTEILEMCMSIYNDIVKNLFDELLVFKGYAGKRPYRTLQFDSSNLTDVFNSLSEAYMCVFQFDNVKKEIKIYSRTNPEIGQENYLNISPNNFMTGIQRTDNTEKVVTRLYLKGIDDISVAGVNPTGQRYIDDFSYFMSTEYMSQELIDALNKYKKIISDKAILEKIERINSNLESLNTSLASQQDYQYKAEEAMKEYEEVGALINTTTDAEKKKEYEKEQEALYRIIEDYQTQYSDENIEDYKESIENWTNMKIEYQKSFLYENVVDSDENKIFTSTLIDELFNFVIEDELNVDTVDDDTTLFYYGKEYLKYVNTIPVTITVSSIDILSNYKYQYVWNKLNKVGDYIMIDYEPFGLNKEYFKLISYSHNPVSNELLLNFSNTEDITNDYNNLLNKVWQYSYNLSKNVEKYKSMWDEYAETKEKLIQEGDEINTSVNRIKNGKGIPIIDSTGIITSKDLDNVLKNLSDGLFVDKNALSGENKDEAGIPIESIENISSFSQDIFTGNVITNLKNYKCLPNIQLGSDGKTLEWTDTEHTYKALTTKSIMGCVEINGINIQLKEYQLQEAEDLNKLTSNDVQPLTIDNKQVYYVSILGGTNQYEYFTFIPPKTRNPEITDEIAAMYQVYIRKYEKSYIKSEYKLVESNDTYNIEIVMGSGSEDNDNNDGKAIILKNNSGLNIEYISRTTSTAFGFHIVDDKIYQVRNGEEFLLRPVHVIESLPETGEPEDIYLIKS